LETHSAAAAAAAAAAQNYINDVPLLFDDLHLSANL